MTVDEVIAKVIEKTGVGPLDPDKTCDQLMVGSGGMHVKGIGTTFMATLDVLKRAVDAGINMIITHEPTWYTGHDQVTWLKDDPIYEKKLEFIQKHELAIWRYHDHMHMAKEDGIYRGLLKDLGWQNYGMETNRNCFEIPELPLKDLCIHLKKTLNVKMLRIVGNPECPIKRVGLFVGGFSLGFGTEQFPMEIIRKENLNAVVCGDILEWTICPYIRDAVTLNMDRSMIVIGHERSEESGMHHLVEWLEPVFADMNIKFLDAGEPFDYF